MAKYFLTGGLAGPWKKRKVDNLKPVYIPATVTQDAETHVMSATTDVTFEDLEAIYAKNKNIIIEADAEFIGAKMYIPLGSKMENGFHFAAASLAGNDMSVGQIIHVIVASDDSITIKVQIFAPYSG